MVKRNVIGRINVIHLGKNIGHKEIDEEEVEMLENSWSALFIPSIISIQFSVNVERTKSWWVKDDCIAKCLPKMVSAQIIIYQTLRKAQVILKKSLIIQRVLKWDHEI